MIPDPGRMSTIVTGGVLLGSGILAVVAPGLGPLATLLVLILGVRTWRAAWKASWGTTLRGALVWAAVAIAMGMLAQVVALSEPLESGRPWTARITYLMVLSILAGLISVLGARNPGGGAWAILMVLLVVVFLIPWLEGSGRLRRAQGLAQLQLDSPWTLFYGLLVLAGITNYLPTRYGPAAIGLGAGLVLEYLGLTRAEWTAPSRAMAWTGVAWLSGASLWLAGWCAEPTSGRAQPPGAALVRLPRPVGRRLGPADPGAVQPDCRARTMAIPADLVRARGGGSGESRRAGRDTLPGRGHVPRPDPPFRDPGTARRPGRPRPGAVLSSRIAGRMMERANPLRTSSSSTGGSHLERQGKFADASLAILAVLASIAALYLLRAILIPIAMSLVIACMFSPLASFVRRWFPFGPVGALGLFLLLLLGGLYVASLTAESLFSAAHTLPGEVERLAGQVSARINDLIRDQPYLRGFLPEPGTIDRLGDTNSALLIEKLSYGLSDLTVWVVNAFIVLVLVIFLLVESPMLTGKVIRFFAKTPPEATRASDMLTQVTRKIRSYLIARTLINLGLGTGHRAGALVSARSLRPGAGTLRRAHELRPLHRPAHRGDAADGHHPGTDGVDR